MCNNVKKNKIAKDVNDSASKQSNKMFTETGDVKNDKVRNN